MRSKNPGLTVSMLLLGFAACLTGCGDGAEPQAISDQERDRLAQIVAQASWIEDAVCNVEVFRQEGEITYGWAECSNLPSIDNDQFQQAHSAPFRAEGDTVQVPEDGAQYSEDLERLFPADLHSTIEQYSGVYSPTPDSN